MVDSLDCQKAALRLFTVVVLSAFVPGASGTAQESRPRGAQVHQDEAAVVRIPEPMVFDLVRGLGAVQGEAEVNVLGVFPLRTSDPHGVEWAPGIEAAVLDGFALEFELPLEDTHLEAVKFAAQYTFGTAFDNHFIHGVQGIAEWFRDAEEWEATLIYLAGIRIGETWSLLSMFGLRTHAGEGHSLSRESTDVRGSDATDSAQRRNSVFTEAHVVKQDVHDVGPPAAVTRADLRQPLVQLPVLGSPLVCVLVKQHIVLGIVLNLLSVGRGY